MQAKIDEEYYRLLRELQEADFVLVELSLYLNTHPNDINAITQHNQLVQKRYELAGQYEHRYGPLMQFGHSYSRHPWGWKEAPWPWQV